MAIRKIMKEGEEVLTKKARPVEAFDSRLWELLDDMHETLCSVGNGAGLAAPQVGVLRRVVVIDLGEGLMELVNPEILSAQGEQRGTEGCLSCPGQWGIVARPAKVTVKAFDRNGEEFQFTGESMLARCVCHEVDHLEGRIFKEIAERMLEPGEEAFKEDEEN